jgi:hypothetical protein
MPAIIIPDRWARRPAGDVKVDLTHPLAKSLRYFVLTDAHRYQRNCVDGSVLSVVVESTVTLTPTEIITDAVGSGQVEYALSKSSWVGSYAISFRPTSAPSVPWMFASATAWDGLYTDASTPTAGYLTSNSGFSGGVVPASSAIDRYYRNCFSIHAANDLRGQSGFSNVATDTSAPLPVSALSKLVLGGDYSGGNAAIAGVAYWAVWDSPLSDAEMCEFNRQPYALLRKAPRILYFPSAGGGATGTGAPAAQSATVAGTATRTVTGSGAPAAQAATASGTAEREITSSGTPAAQSATVSGTGTVGAVVTGSGAPQAQSATVAGTAERTVTASGTVAAQSATVAGTAEREITSSGTPTAQSATVVGTGQVGNIITGSGTPTAQSATVSGTAEREITASGTISASAATVVGTAERTITATGTLAASSATVYGFDSAPVSGNPTSGGGTGKVYSSKKLRREVDEWLEKQQESERQKFLARLQREDEELMVIMLALAA